MPVTGTGSPWTVTELNVFASVTLPETWTRRLRIVLPSAGAVICTTGGVLSMFRVTDRLV